MTDIRYPYQGGVTSTDGQGLVIDSITGQLTLVLDGTSLSKSSSGLKWNDASTQFIDVSSSTTAFRVTQRGTGAALLVEDSTNPDSTPFVIDANGNVGIGLTTPITKLHISGQSFFDGAITVGATSTPTHKRFRLDRTDPNDNAVLEFYNGAQNMYWFFENQGIGGKGQIRTDSARAIILQSDFTSSLGFVGIGTESPGSKLSVSASTAIGASYCTLAAPSNSLIVQRYVGCGTSNPTSALHLGQTAGVAEAATCLLDEKDTTPASPTSGTQVKMYMKADKIIFQYNDGGTVRYKYLDLTGTTDTWTASTTAP